MVYFVKVIINRYVIENFAESAYSCYPKTGGLSTSNKKMLRIKKLFFIQNFAQVY